MKKQILATGFVLFSFTLPFKATAAVFSQIYVFGDSLSDTGNTFQFTGGAIPPSPPYSPGRFSNGLNWIDYLAQDLELNPTTFADVALGGAIPTEGTNFAFGGTTTGEDNTVSLTFPNIPVELPALQEQISLFTSNLTSTADPEALYILWAGANDYLPTEGSFVPFTEPRTPIANLSTAIDSLVQVGAENIMVVNLPDLGNTPVALATNQLIPGISEGLNTVTEAHNSALSTVLNGFADDANIISFDVNSLFDRVLNNSDDFGFTNVTNSCLVSLQPLALCDNPDEFLFWDAQHPTTKTHEIIANAALETLTSESVPEPTSGLGILVFGIFGTKILLLKSKHQ